MQEKITEQLKEIIFRYGVSVCDKPKRLESLLKDLCPNSTRENFVLLTVVRLGIIDELVEIKKDYKFKSTRLKNKVINNCGIESKLANWAVDSWAYALGIIDEVIKPEEESNEQTGKDSKKDLEKTNKKKRVNRTKKTTDNNMVLVKAGTTSEDNGAITIEEDFYISKYHVTQAEFEEMMGFNPSEFNNRNHPNLTGNTANRPVERVSWYDAVKYANKLSEKEGLEKYYNINNIEYDGDNIDYAEVTENEGANGYCLPTEKEHEYAARGGKDGNATTYAGSDDLDEVGWYRDKSDAANSEYDGWVGEGNGTIPVGEKEANELGLYDMSGNVYDWTNTPSGSRRVVRGGSWNLNTLRCEVSYSYSNTPSFTNYYLGFRLARRSLEKTNKEKRVNRAKKTVNNNMVLVEKGEAAISPRKSFFQRLLNKRSETESSLIITNNFYLAKYQVTQAEFKKIMGFNPSYFNNKDHPNLAGNTANRPVERVTWYDAIMYCNKLSEAEGLGKYYNISDIEHKGDKAHQHEYPQNINDAEVTENEGANGYRLPTENEHEYAMRGGKDGDATIYAGSDYLDEVGWYNDNSDAANSYRINNKGTMPVGMKKANELGLFDMSGNVTEWTNTLSSFDRVRQGGSWYSVGSYCEVSKSFSLNPSVSSDSIGFRLARHS